MAAKTTTADGNWNAGATWTGGVAPVAGDTVTISHNVTITANVDIGSSPATGGTAAIAFDTGVGGKTLTINAGVTVIARGDVIIQSTTSPFYNTLHINGTGVLALTPGAGKRYDVKCQNFKGLIVISGSAGNYGEIKTDLSGGGDAGRMFTDTDGTGLITCDYGQFTDLGDGTNYGVQVSQNSATPTDVPFTITNSRFVRTSFSGFWHANTGGFPFDENVTFQGNVFEDSTVVDAGGDIDNLSASFRFLGTPTADWLVDTNGFDAKVYLFVYNPDLSFTNNVLASLLTLATSSWDAAHFSGNIFTNIDQDMAIYGASASCYALSQAGANPHFFGMQVGGVTMSGHVLESETGTLGDGITPLATGNLTVTGCLVLPIEGSEYAACNLVSCVAKASGAVTVRHNTTVGRMEGGMVHLGEGGTSYAGEAADVRSNLVTSLTAVADSVWAISDDDDIADTVTLATYNAFWNANTGTNKYNTNTSQAGVLGYSGLKIVLNDNYPNAQVGDNDITISGSGLFVDPDRNFKAWGVYKGQAATLDAAIAYAVANPAAATDADTGLRAWVMDGFAPTGAAGEQIQDAGHDGVTQGAMEFVADENAATTYTVSPSGTEHGFVDRPKYFSFQADGDTTAEITLATDGDGTWSDGGTITLDGTNEVTATYTPNDFADSPHILSFTNDGGLDDPDDVTLIVTDGSLLGCAELFDDVFEPLGHPHLWIGG
jgi:hypothetical protein